MLCSMARVPMSANFALPNLIVAGAAKCGTSSLHAYLSAHPDIYGSLRKDIQYFDPLIWDEAPLLPALSGYAKHFSDAGSQRYRLESSASYWMGGRLVAEAISETLDEPYVLIVLRDPVDRLRSAHRYTQGNLGRFPSELTFDEYLDKVFRVAESDQRLSQSDTYEWHAADFVRGGLYGDLFQAWHDVLGNRLQVVFTEDLALKPRATLSSVCDWLGITPRFYDNYEFATWNASIRPRSPKTHALATRVNAFSARFWRKHPHAKRSLVRAYRSVNGAAVEQRSSETASHASEYFAESNRDLAEQLATLGYRDLPAWLRVG